METLTLTTENEILTVKKLECLINGKIEKYHFCAMTDLAKAVNFYSDCVYIGSSNIYFISGVKRESNDTFF